MIVTQKIKIYPTQEQEKILWEQSDICRRLYNISLDVLQFYYKSSGKMIKKNDLNKKIKRLRNIGYEKWNYIQSRVTEQVIGNLYANYKSTFTLLEKWKENPQYKMTEHGKVPKNKPSFPKFKGWKYFSTFTYNQSGFKLKENTLYLSLGPDHPKYQYHWEDKRFQFDISHYPLKYKGKIKQIQIYRNDPYKDHSSEYYISINVDTKVPQYTDNGLYQAFDIGLTDLVVGVNLHSRFITFSNLRNDKYWKDKISEIDTKISRCLGSKQGQRKSNRWKFLNKKKRKMFRKQANQTKDFYHNLAKKIIKNTKANTIIIGDLNIKYMARKKKGTGSKMKNKSNKTLNRRLFNIKTFITYLKYKAEKYGKKVIEISEKNTTQMCCKCNHIKKGDDKLGLKDREYICDHCGNQMDRDRNSAINIMKRFLSYKDQQKYDLPITERSTAEQSFREKWFIATHSPMICPQAKA